jgi:ferredoxin
MEPSKVAEARTVANGGPGTKAGSSNKQRQTRRRGVTNSSTLKVRVDRDKCQGHNRCKALAPELFELDEYGNAREKGDGTVPAGLEEKAYLAKSNCPEFAVEVIETKG